MAENKRRFTRIPFKVKAQIIIDGSLHSTAELSNLGIGGCFLPAGEDLNVGTHCLIVILLSENGSDVNLQVEGVVVRCEADGVAIRFKQIDPDSLFHLKNIIRYNTIDSKSIENEINKHPGLL